MVKHSLRHFLLLLVLVSFGFTVHAQPPIGISIQTPGDAGNFSEGCNGPFQLVLTRTEGNTDTVTLFLAASGDATIPFDYSFPFNIFPLEILPDDTLITIPITIVNDGTIEGLESILWEFTFVTSSQTGNITITTSIVDDFEVEINALNDTIQWCRFAPLPLQATSTSDIYWSPAGQFDPAEGNSVIVRPFESGWYYATVGSDTCGAKDSIYLDLAIADILQPDTVYICKDADGITLDGQISGLADNFKWVPSDSTLSDTNSLHPNANPQVTTTYILQSDFGVCIASDTVVVRVDSLPLDLHIDIAPLKPYYCQGEIVALFSSNFDSLKFPDLNFLWTPFNETFLSDSNTLNAALQLIDTTLYVREKRNNACVDSDSILINVVSASIPLSLTDTLLCPGEQFQVHVLSNQVTEPEWMPETGLSCVKCLNPTVTVEGLPGSSLVYMFSGMILQCPVGASFLLQIPPMEEINITGDNIVCEGDITTLTINNTGLTDIQWSVAQGSASLSCTNCLSPQVTINSGGEIILSVSANTTSTNFCGAFGNVILHPGQDEPIQIVGDNVVCDGDVTSLTIVNGGLENIQWSVVSGSATLSCNNCVNPDVTVNGNSDVTLRVNATSTQPDFCNAVGEIILHQGSVETLAGFTISGCAGSTVIATTGDPSLMDVVWDVIGGNPTLSCSVCPAPVVTINNGGKLRFFATNNDPAVCKVVGTVDVSIYPGDPADLLYTPAPPDTIFQGNEVSVTLNVQGPPPTNPMWTVNGTAISATGTSITFNANNEINQVSVKFINSLGCEQTVTIEIPTVPPFYKIPNAFTPGNNDGLNDKFRIITNGNIVVEKFQIFNRWGQLVYKAEGNDLEGWDGNFKGQPAASDTYVYTAELRLPNGDIKVAKGDVMLIK